MEVFGRDDKKNITIKNVDITITTTVLGTHASYVNGVIYFEKKRKIASAGADEKIFLWDLDRGFDGFGFHPIQIPFKDSSNISCLIKYNDELLFAGSSHGGVRCFSIETYRDVCGVVCDSMVFQLLKIRDELLVSANGNGIVSLISFTDRKTLKIIHKIKNDETIEYNAKFALSKKYSGCFYLNMEPNKTDVYVIKLLSSENTSTSSSSSSSSSSFSNSGDSTIKEFLDHGKAIDITSMNSFVRSDEEYLLCGTSNSRLIIYEVETCEVIFSTQDRGVNYVDNTSDLFFGKYYLGGDYCGNFSLYSIEICNKKDIYKNSVIEFTEEEREIFLKKKTSESHVLFLSKIFFKEKVHENWANGVKFMNWDEDKKLMTFCTCSDDKIVSMHELKFVDNSYSLDMKYSNDNYELGMKDIMERTYYLKDESSVQDIFSSSSGDENNNNNNDNDNENRKYFFKIIMSNSSSCMNILKIFLVLSY